MIFRNICEALVAVALLSCDSSAAGKPNRPERADRSWEQALAEVLADAPPDDCAQHPDLKICEDVVVSSVDHPFDWPEDPRQRTMVIDVDLDAASLSKYRNRIIERYRPNPSGTYVRYNATLKMPRGLDQAMEVLSDRRSYGFLSAEYDLMSSTVVDKLQRTFHTARGYHVAGHGGPILASLAELNPQAGFVLVEHIDPGPRDILCAQDWPGLHAYFENAASSLRSIAIDTHTKFINLSAGVTEERTLRSWSRTCPNARPLTPDGARQVVAAYRKLFKALSDIPGVTLVTAASVALHDTRPTAATFTDCDLTDFPNRINVGMAYFADSAIPPEGLSISSSLAELPRAWTRLDKCIHVYVNSGFVEDSWDHGGPQSVHLYDYQGIDKHPASAVFIGTSDIAPLLLSRLIDIRVGELGPLDLGAAQPQHLLAALTGGGSRRLQDPLKHNAFQTRMLPFVDADRAGHSQALTASLKPPNYPWEGPTASDQVSCDGDNIVCDLSATFGGRFVFRKAGLSPVGSSNQAGKLKDGLWQFTAAPGTLLGALLTTPAWTILPDARVSVRVYYKALWQGYLPRGVESAHEQRLFNIMVLYDNPDSSWGVVGTSVKVADLETIQQSTIPAPGEQPLYMASTWGNAAAVVHLHDVTSRAKPGVLQNFRVVLTDVELATVVQIDRVELEIFR